MTDAAKKVLTLFDVDNIDILPLHNILQSNNLKYKVNAIIPVTTLDCESVMCSVRTHYSREICNHLISIIKNIINCYGIDYKDIYYHALRDLLKDKPLSDNVRLACIKDMQENVWNTRNSVTLIREKYI